MGTILTHEQVNPWAVMGANLAGSLIGDMIQRSRQAEENKKLNALFSEVQNSMAAPQAQNFIAQSQVMPEGYDTNPWAAALHQSYTPMTQYNLATADVNPLVQAQQANNIPSVQAMRNAVLQNLATKRFGMLDPAKVEQFMTPYYQSAQQAQQEALRKEYADKLMNAQDSAERRNIAWSGAGVGVFPWDAVNAANGEYRYDNMSAADKAANLFRNMQFGESQRQFDTQTGLTREKMAQDNAHFEATRSDDNYWRDRQFRNEEDAARYARENPGYSSVFTGDDGGQWVVDRYGNTKKLNTGESNSSTRLTPDENKRINDNIARIKDLENQRQEIYKLRTDIIKSNITGEANTKDYDDRIAAIDDEIGQLKDGINQIYQSKRRPQISASDVNPPFPKISNMNYKKNTGSSKWKYGNFIDKAASKYDVDPALIQAVIDIESAGNPNAVSNKGAQGLMQLMPDTAKFLEVTDSLDPEQNVNGGTKYLSQLLKKYNGDVEKALWAYNAGPGNVAKGNKPAVTQKYIKDVLAKYETYNSNDDNTPKKLSNEDYAHLLEMVKAGNFPDIRNEAELQAKLKEYGRSFDVGIKPQDVNVFAEPQQSQANDIASDDVTVFPEARQETQVPQEARSIFPKKDFDYLVQKAKMGTLYYAKNEDQVREYLHKKGYRIEGE